MSAPPEPFVVTTPATTVALDGARRGQCSVSVTNVTGRPMRARLRMVPTDPAQADWYAVAGEAERDFGLGATHAYTVGITVPPDVAAGTYSVRCDAISEDQPQEVFTSGPAVAITVPPAAGGTRFPWWIVAVAAGTLAAAALIVFFLSRGGGQEVPEVVGQPATAAIDTLTNAGFVADPATVSTDPCDPPVTTQDPTKDDEADEGATVTLTFGPCTNVAAVPDVRGRPISVASDLLAIDGFVPEVILVGNSQSCDPPVTDQKPLAGTQAAAGTSVILAVPREPAGCLQFVDDIRLVDADISVVFADLAPRGSP